MFFFHKQKNRYIFVLLTIKKAANMRNKKNKQIILLFSLVLSAAWCVADNISAADHNPVQVMESKVTGPPKGSSIQATINGHYLTVVFLENLGQVNIVITDAYDNEIRVESTPTPTGVNIYILNTGSYVVTFTLPNGDEYYGEFEVTD